MIFLRSLAFNIAFYGWTAICALVFLPLLAGPERYVRKAGSFWVRSSLWLLEILCNIRYHTEGQPNRPQKPIIIASKHQSAFETLAFTQLFENYCFVLKKDLLYLPVFGWYLMKLNMIAVDRSGGIKALKTITKFAKREQNRGKDIIIYPEGTRTNPGDRIPYQAGVAALYLRLDTPVLPLALNSGLFWGRNAFLKKPGDITIRYLPLIETGLGKEDFMQKLEQSIEEASENLADT